MSARTPRTWASLMKVGPSSARVFVSRWARAWWNASVRRGGPPMMMKRRRSRRKPKRKGRSAPKTRRDRISAPLQQGAGEHDRRHREVDDDPGHVDQGGDEGRRGRRRVEAEALEHEGGHRPRERAESDHADEGTEDGRGHQPVVGPVV